MRNKSKSKRTEATLSLLVTSALVITLAIAVASAIKKGSNTDEPNNIINLNETEAPGLSLNNSNPDTGTSPASDIKQAKNSDLYKTKDTDITDSINDVGLIDETVAETTALSDENVPVDAGSKVNTSYSFSESDRLLMPVSGEIILSYNMDNTIWFPTLGVYKCNPGIYISSDVGTDVIASATGCVESITINEELGNIVTIDMGNGYKSSYGQLDNITVQKGEVVLAGSKIGSVSAPTIYYSKEGSGVYFKLTNNDIPANPLDYME